MSEMAGEECMEVPLVEVVLREGKVIEEGVHLVLGPVEVEEVYEGVEEDHDVSNVAVGDLVEEVGEDPVEVWIEVPLGEEVVNEIVGALLPHFVKDIGQYLGVLLEEVLVGLLHLLRSKLRSFFLEIGVL
jgi:hypothetical protein